MDGYAPRFGHLPAAKVQHALDRFGLGDLLETREIVTGNFGQNLHLGATTGDYILRGNPFFDWQLPKERETARILHERTTVPVPWPYHHEPSTELFGWDYAIMPRLPGEMVNNTPMPGQVALATALAETLARLQDASFDRAMEFDLDAGAFVPPTHGERGHLSRRIEHNLELSFAASDRTSDADSAWVQTLLADVELASSSWGPSCLVHGDFTINNVVAVHSREGWEITGVFDFMTARIGSFEADLCRQFALYHWRTPVAATAFLETYLELRPPRAGYRDRVPLLLLDERLTLWEWLQRTRPEWWRSDIGLRDWAEPVLDAMLAYG